MRIGAGTFPTRLRRCQVDGDMTISDLARWFDRPRATVNTWITKGRTPFGPAGRQAITDLAKLEAAIARKRGFPVPNKLTWAGRAKYLQELRDGIRGNSRVPAGRTAV